MWSPLAQAAHPHPQCSRLSLLFCEARRGHPGWAQALFAPFPPVSIVRRKVRRGR